MRHSWRAAAAAMVVLAACEPSGPRVAGTSTTVGTSIGGTALLSDGRPAAGALVAARGDDIVFRGGVPQARLIDSSRTDSLGRFRLRAPGAGFHLDISWEASVTAALPEGGQVYQGWVEPEGGKLPDAGLANPGSLHGAVSQKAEASDTLVWIGIAGTARFVTATGPAGKREFTLNGAYPGDRNLVILGLAPDTGSAQKVGAYRVESGQVTEIGILP